MKIKLKWLTRALWLIILPAVLQGCATYVATSLAPDERKFFNTPVLTDEILAIGRPDAALLKQMDLSNTIAFIGRENTYMLYLGGEELEQISKLKLDPKRMTISSEQSLYLKDKQVWGEIEINYQVSKEVSVVEMAELKMGGFAPDQRRDRKGYYRTTIRIEGVVYPAIKIPDDKISKLSVQRRFNLYNPREASPPILGKIMKVPIIATGIVIDAMLYPVYLGVGGVVVLGAAVSGGAR